MSYKKFLKAVTLPKAKLGVRGNSGDNATSIYDRYKNYLPAVYQGPNNRCERYTIYDGMEQDPIISWSLDTIVDYVIQADKDKPFKIEYTANEKLPDSQTLTIEKELDDWVKTNEWKKRMYPTIRDALKYGDVFFVRDPDTYELQKVNIYDVLGVVVDDLKNPTHYVIKNVELNVPLKVATTAQSDVTTRNLLNTINSNFPGVVNASNTANASTSPNPTDDNTTLPVSADNVIHLSLNVDNELLFPFGLSILEKIYKIYIQKMLLQDCILLYRIKNATEKLVFYIPVGGIPRYKRKQILEKTKNELSQRRMPAKDTDGVFNTIDVAYNSIPMNEDYFLPVDSDGVQPKIEKLAGGQALGEINDMVFWENLLIRGMNVPQSWVPYGPTDGQRTLPTNVANAYVQELRFFKFCCRIQDILIPELDKEYKRFLQHRGINVNEDSFNLTFNEPSNITEISEEEIKTNRLNAFLSASGSQYISKQFALKYYLKLTEEEFNENQRLLIIENQNRFKNEDVELPTEDKNQIPGLRTVGIEDISMDYLNDMAADMNAGMESLGGMPAGGDMSSMGNGEMGGGMPSGDAGGMGIAPTADAGSTPSV